MSWMNKLYATYENCESMVGKREANDKTPLLPIAHSTQNAQIEVSLDINGDFKDAGAIDKKDAVTVIPVNEDSAARGNGNYPHPLFDKLQYLAGDYTKFVDNEKGQAYFEAYIKQLDDWCNSPFQNKKVSAILTYLKKGTLISDLIDQKVLACGENGKLNAAVKLDAASQCDAFVRFRVNAFDDNETKIWQDKDVQDSFIRYYLSLQDTKALCYASGEVIPSSEKHPSKIRNSADKAKLISGNDTSGFTFRGRFSDKNQAVSVGYEISQKAHNALKWLIDKQGYRNYDEVIVAWGTQNQNIPPIPEDTFELFPDEVRLSPPSTSEDYAQRLSSAISGYKCDLDNKSEIVVMGLDSATTGRLSITYYREMNGFELLERIQNWHSTCIWRHSYKYVSNGVDQKGKPKYQQISFIGAPAPKDIAYAAFGLKASDKLIKSTVKRILPCIVDGAKLPGDIVNAAVNRAKRPIVMKENDMPYEWEKVRSITCALVKKYREERFEKEVWSMELNKTESDTNYLYGRLLAAADEIEGWALKEMKEERATNAIRLFERFAQRPSETWKTISVRLIPYQIKLGKKCEWLLDIKEDISSLMNKEDYNSFRNLDGRFILGFDCQKKDIRDEKIRRAEAKANQKNQIPQISEKGRDENGKLYKQN